MFDHFQYYNGAGNSFMVADGRNFLEMPNPIEIIKICCRENQKKTDGILILEKSINYCYKMRYFNSDGSEAFCGNGARVLAFFAHQLGIIDKTGGYFEAIDGIHQAKFDGNQWGILMKKVEFKDIESKLEGYFLNTVVPHCVQSTDELNHLDISTIAPNIRHNSLFENGTNVNFYEIIDKKIHLRTYERGVEAETLACGTGATAVGLVAAFLKNFSSPIQLQTKGGILSLFFVKNTIGFSDIWLFGPVEKHIN